MDLNKINEEINKLQQERKRILDEQNKSKIEEFKKLEWTKKCRGILRVDSWGAAGLPKYKISLFGDIPMFNTNDILTLMGNSKNYTQNINYKESDFGSYCPCIFTNNKDILIEFILKAQFLNIEYDKDTLGLFQALQSRYN